MREVRKHFFKAENVLWLNEKSIQETIFPIEQYMNNSARQNMPSQRNIEQNNNNNNNNIDLNQSRESTRNQPVNLDKTDLGAYILLNKQSPSNKLKSYLVVNKTNPNEIKSRSSTSVSYDDNMDHSSSQFQ